MGLRIHSPFLRPCPPSSSRPLREFFKNVFCEHDVRAFKADLQEYQRLRKRFGLLRSRQSETTPVGRQALFSKQSKAHELDLKYGICAPVGLNHIPALRQASLHDLLHYTLNGGLAGALACSIAGALFGDELARLAARFHLHQPMVAVASFGLWAGAFNSWLIYLFEQINLGDILASARTMILGSED